MTRSFVIGKEGELPWKLPLDLFHFKTITLHHPIIMGRKTHESIGRVLPERLNIVLSNTAAKLSNELIVCSSIVEAFSTVKKAGYRKAFIIGGSKVFQMCLPFVDKIYLTLIHQDVKGDTFFPFFNPLDWNIVERVDAPFRREEELSYSFLTLQRKI